MVTSARHPVLVHSAPILPKQAVSIPVNRGNHEERVRSCCYQMSPGAWFFCAAGAQAADAQTTITVPADQPSIQAGIDAAANGDTVMVAPGTYFENLNFNGKLITVTSSDGPATTIIDGGGLGPVAIFDTNESANSVLNGFTLQNGLASLNAPAPEQEGVSSSIALRPPLPIT